MKKVQVLAAVMFVVAYIYTPAAAAPAPRFACESEIYSCFGNKVTWNDCQEDCGFNWSWCVNYCGGNPTNFQCSGVPPATDGSCECAPCME
ncbi:MAG: hypothetical protein AMXMBFR57_32440 [Acidimicrobiia bacterium]|jgi:hypothetical protein